MAPSPTTRQLVILGCSQTKTNAAASYPVPAILRYDGPLFRVLRAHLRDYRWPSQLSVAVLSAKYGLIGGLTGIEDYNLRLTPERAQKIQPSVTQNLARLLSEHGQAELFMGRDYLDAIDWASLGDQAGRVQFIEGGIGHKLHLLRQRLDSFSAPKSYKAPVLPRLSRPLYFLPDWDDFVDLEYDFLKDRLSNHQRQARKEAHTLEYMRPLRVCDGVLVSLAQHLGTKGLLKRVRLPTTDSLAPQPVRSHFGLSPDQWAFGDCGAFSYAGEEEPPLSVKQAVAIYDFYGFDLGASVDHIPLIEVHRNGARVPLTNEERQARVDLTRKNAEEFLQAFREQGARFLPVGVIQGLKPKDYAEQVLQYVDMGYQYIALGGLVPRSDAEVLEITEAVHAQLRRLPEKPWLHLMGIYRPKLQKQFRKLWVSSFDSATYFRKAWLRSDQNYLGPDGEWYAAIRVPPSHDAATAKRLRKSGRTDVQIKALERNALDALRAYDRGRTALEVCLSAVIAYDNLLERADSEENHLKEEYRKTLQKAPWRNCPCPVCRKLGIEVLLFRGLNRNKRRGAHNTWRLFHSINP